MKLAQLLPAAALTLLCASACISPIDPGAVRFFEPVAHGTDRAPAQVAAQPLNLQSVQAPAYLGLPMVWRRSDVEVAFDERNRWAVEPAAHLQEALLRALFVQGPFFPRESRTTPRLEVRVLAYEGTFAAPATAVVAVVAILSIPEPARTETQRFEAAVPLRRTSPEDLARGVGAAQDQITTELLAWLASILQD